MGERVVWAARSLRHGKPGFTRVSTGGGEHGPEGVLERDRTRASPRIILRVGPARITRR